MFSRTCRPLAVAVMTLLAGAQEALADGMVGPVSTDPFDSTRGTVIVADDTIVDPINAFRTSGGFEDGHTLMRNGGLGSLSFIEFDTAGPVSIVGVRLFAASDEPYWLRRAMSHFTLRADADGDAVFETLVADVEINPYYALQPGNAASDPGRLDLTLAAGGVITAQHWRLEVTQGSDVQPYEGARLVELDAIPVPDADGDGIPDDLDACPATPPDGVTDASGCTIGQRCPCEGQWPNHGRYVSCVAHAAEAFLASGLIGEADKDAVVSEAAGSACGK